MDVSTAIARRISCRAFLSTPVAQQTVVEILEIAKRAPSGGNLQPWIVHVVTGQPLQSLIRLVRGRTAVSPQGEGTEYNIYPPSLHEPYRSRRFKCGEDMYATIDVTRDNKLGRLAQWARNFEFFGAPVALFFVVDRRMDRDQWADIGMFMQSIMLLAVERGLATCAQEAWAIWHKTVGEFLRLPPEHMLFCGMALGYPDESARINQLRTDRAELSEFVTMHG